MHKLPAKVIILSWLLVGTLDISAAIIHHYIRGGNNPSVIFVYIASAINGPEYAMQADHNSMVIFGLFLHYLIAFIWTVIFFNLYKRIAVMRKHVWLTGIVFGYFVQIIMSQVVLPLSYVARAPFTVKGFLINGGILVIAIGIPLAFIASRYYTNKISTADN